jgi:two-component system, NarL family, response regulator NreC
LINYINVYLREKAMQNLTIDSPSVVFAPSTKAKTKIVIVEDHTILRDGLRSLLSAQNEFEVIGEAGDGLEAIKCVAKLNPDVVLIDLSMPRMNGSASIREIKRQSPQIKVLALTIHKTEEYIREAFNAGADGYCLKDATHAELIMAINSIQSGKQYISPGISDKLLRGYLEGKTGSEGAGSSFGSLTSREKEVLKLIGEGYKNKEISKYLFISVKTVEKHRANIMKKIDLHNASALTAYAIEKGLVTK